MPEQDPVAMAVINAHRQDVHEQLCAVRYENIHSSIDELKAVFKWTAATIIGLILSVLGWSVVQQFNANENQKAALEARINMLQEQKQDAKVN